MSKSKFYLRKTDVNGFQTIYLYGTANGKQAYTNTNIKTKPNGWDSIKQIAIYDKWVNTRLELIAKAANIYLDGLDGKQPTNEGLKRAVAACLKNYVYYAQGLNDDTPVPVSAKKNPLKKPKPKSNFFAVIDKFIEEAPNRTNANGERICERRVKMYIYEKQALKEFENKFNKELTFEDFDVQTLMQFQTFLTNKNLKNNTVVRYFKLLWVFFRYAEDTLNIPVNQAFRKFKIRTNKKESVVLNEKEIQRIWDYKCESERENNVRKLFLIGLHTGMRFGDYSTLTANNINYTEETISTIQNKTGQRVTIPLHPRLADMLKNEPMPHSISNEKFNYYLHQLMKKIGFNQVVEVKSIVGGKRVIEYKEKWELISSHTARRSFATNLYKDGVNPSIIMLCTGHRDLDTFMKYVVLDNQDKLQVVRNLWQTKSV